MLSTVFIYLEQLSEAERSRLILLCYIMTLLILKRLLPQHLFVLDRHGHLDSQQGPTKQNHNGQWAVVHRQRDETPSRKYLSTNDLLNKIDISVENTAIHLSFLNRKKDDSLLPVIRFQYLICFIFKTQVNHTEEVPELKRKKTTFYISKHSPNNYHKHTISLIPYHHSFNARKARFPWFTGTSIISLLTLGSAWPYFTIFPSWSSCPLQSSVAFKSTSSRYTCLARFTGNTLSTCQD